MPSDVAALIITPYSGDENELRYAYAAFRHSLNKGELPFVPALHYTDGGIGGRLVEPIGPDPHSVAKVWIKKKPDVVAFYMDLGLSHDMHEIMQLARQMKLKISKRYF